MHEGQGLSRGMAPEPHSRCLAVNCVSPSVGEDIVLLSVCVCVYRVVPFPSLHRGRAFHTAAGRQDGRTILAKNE